MILYNELFMSYVEEFDWDIIIAVNTNKLNKK